MTNKEFDYNDESGSEEAELLRQIKETKAKIQQRIAALLAHTNVPEYFKNQLEKFTERRSI